MCCPWHSGGMRTALVVGLLGAIGSVARWGMATAIQERSGARFPWGTLVVNLVGSIAIGAVMTLYAMRAELDSRTRIALTSGLLGGFTTYSSFAYETWGLVWSRDYIGAGLYVALTVGLCFAGCTAGVVFTRSMAAA